jgi:hypothetical protein
MKAEDPAGLVVVIRETWHCRQSHELKPLAKISLAF